MTLGRAAFDAAHRVTRLTDLRPGTSTKARSFAWSPGGMLNTMQDQTGSSQGGARTDYLYDPVGNLIGIWGPNFDYLAFTHDAGGRLTEKWDPNGINSQYSWNADNTLAALDNRVAFDDAHVISHHAYDYDALGRRQTAVDKAGTLTLPAQSRTIPTPTTPSTTAPRKPSTGWLSTRSSMRPTSSSSCEAAARRGPSPMPSCTTPTAI